MRVDYVTTFPPSESRDLIFHLVMISQTGREQRTESDIYMINYQLLHSIFILSTSHIVSLNVQHTNIMAQSIQQAVSDLTTKVSETLGVDGDSKQQQQQRGGTKTEVSGGERWFFL
jgi:hypothetical protein